MDTNADNEILPLLQPPGKEEAELFYYGLPTQPRLVGRASSGIVPWKGMYHEQRPAGKVRTKHTPPYPGETDEEFQKRVLHTMETIEAESRAEYYAWYQKSEKEKKEAAEAARLAAAPEHERKQWEQERERERLAEELEEKWEANEAAAAAAERKKRPMMMDTIGRHNILECREKILPDILAAINHLPWTSVDMFRIGYADLPRIQKPVVVWIGVAHNDMPWDDVARALRACRKILDAAELPDVDVQLRVSNVRIL